MAITKTTTVERLEVYSAPNASAEDTKNEKYPWVMVVYQDKLDEEGDADLPVTATRVKHLYKLVTDDGAATDYSKEDALVKTVCAAIWA